MVEVAAHASEALQREGLAFTSSPPGCPSFAFRANNLVGDRYVAWRLTTPAEIVAVVDGDKLWPGGGPQLSSFHRHGKAKVHPRRTWWCARTKRHFAVTATSPLTNGLPQARFPQIAEQIIELQLRIPFIELDNTTHLNSAIHPHLPLGTPRTSCPIPTCTKWTMRTTSTTSAASPIPLTDSEPGPW